jgi:hypothetical protein
VIGSATPTETLGGFATSSPIEQVQIHDARGLDGAISAAFSPTDAHTFGRVPPSGRLFSSDATLNRSRFGSPHFLPVALLITVTVALVAFRAASEAVTVRRLGPFFNSIAVVLHEDVSKLAAP